MLSNPNEMEKNTVPIEIENVKEKNDTHTADDDVEKKPTANTYRDTERHREREDMCSDTVYLLHKNLCSNIEY